MYRVKKTQMIEKKLEQTVVQWTQLRKCKDIKWIPINLALLTKLVMTSNQPAIKKFVQFFHP